MSTPPQSSCNAFNKLFERSSKAKAIGVMDTLSQAVQSYEDQVKVVESSGVRFEIRESMVDPLRQADRATAQQQEYRSVSLDEYVSRFRPYVPPPPPQPLQAVEGPARRNISSKRRRDEVTAAEYAPRQISYKTTILVTESVHANGQKTYTASTSPLEEVPGPSSNQIIEPALKEQAKIQQPFLQRMKTRQRRLEEFREDRSKGVKGKMLLISVKRQRKLKMKKHKYKKLMKRTRNLRRKLDRN
ncbi:MAG: hypothetical protein M1822_000072 [Bathelium mastoideum]|nr:MAG: hypothetical protein M1822_000072 [Bathelium mastoideum]